MYFRRGAFREIQVFVDTAGRIVQRVHVCCHIRHADGFKQMRNDCVHRFANDPLTPIGARQHKAHFEIAVHAGMPDPITVEDDFKIAGMLGKIFDPPRKLFAGDVDVFMRGRRPKAHCHGIAICRECRRQFRRLWATQQQAFCA